MCTNGNGFTYENEMEEEETLEERKKWIIEIQEVLDYAIQKYGCKFPKRFANRLYSFSHGAWVPNKKIIDAILAEWKIWEPYVSPDSFQKFVNHEISTLFKAHCTATFSVESLNQYIGVKATVTKALPLYMSTTIDMNGLLKKNGEEVRREKM